MKIISQFATKRILVLGDVMLDEYIWGKVSRISPEAPVPVVEVETTSFGPGGAANVANNIRALGGQVKLAGIIGQDEEGRRLKRELKKIKVDVSGLCVDPRRPTTKKTRIIAHSQQVVRVDKEKREKIDEPLIAELMDYALSILPDIDGVVISDYAKGVATSELVRTVILKARSARKIVAANPKPINLEFFKRATVVTLNQQEAESAVGFPLTDEDALGRAGEGLRSKLMTEATLITRGEHGMSLFEKNGNIKHIPAVSSEVYDVTGAGDTVISALTLSLTAGASFLEASKIANYAAAVVIRKLGAAVAKPEELETILNH